jgi:N-acetylneuraminic acid mutarotase
LNMMRRFDPVSNTWTLLAPMPDAVFLASAVYSPINNKVYVFGGEVDFGLLSAATRIYDIATNTWSAGANMPDVRSLMASGYYNGKIYLIAGYSTGLVHDAQTQVWEYDPIANTFNTTRMPYPNANGTGGSGFGVINGHFYVAGGQDANSVVLNLLYDYDIAANTWTPRANLPAPINDPGSGVVNGQLWLFGGQRPYMNTNASIFYDPSCDAWSAGPVLNQSRSFIGGTAIGTTLVAAGGWMVNMSFSTTETSGCGPRPVPQSVFSRKTHGGAGTFDAPLPQTCKWQCRN